MRRHRTRRSPSVVDLSITPATRRRLAHAHFRVDDNATLLMREDADETEIAEAAWRILAQTGGLLDRPAIQKRYGLSRQRTYGLSTNKSFPRPVGTIGDRPVWLAVHVDHYRAHSKPGRRPRNPEAT